MFVVYGTKTFYYGTGRRKSSVARVRLYSGSGGVFTHILAGMIIAIIILAPFACLACASRKKADEQNRGDIYP